MKWMLKELALKYLEKTKKKEEKTILYQITNHCLDEKLSELLIYFISIAQRT